MNNSKMIRFGSVCSGIEAASVAWHPLGWRAAWLSEIEPFPCDVLEHHYPDVPNLGDMTLLPARIRDGEVSAPDVFCGGTPCQAFSVAGLRRSLGDARGNLSLTFCEIANEIDAVRVVRGEQPSVIMWENVPGALNTKDNFFGCFLGALAGESSELQPAGGRWTNAGCVLGPARTVAWRTLDAQYFGVAQRRKRVFVVASARKGFDPAAVLFEFDGLRRDTPPRREAGEGPAHATAPCLTSSGRGVERTGDTRGQDPVVAVAQPYTVANCLTQRMHKGINSTLDEGQTPVLAMPAPVCFAENTRHEVRLEGGDGSRTGALSTGGGKPGQGVPCVAYALQDVRDVQKAQNGRGWNDDGVAYTVDTHATQGVVAAFKGGQGSSAGGIGYSEHVAPTLNSADSGSNRTPVVMHPAYAIQAGALRTNPASGPDGVGVQADHAYTLEARAEVQAVAFQPRHYSDRERMGGEPSEICHTLSAAAGQGDSSPHVATAMQVRRLTPEECEALQGFPRGYTMIPWRKKPASECPDGPRYKALGNSWAVPVVRWIGQRIAEALL
jgi:DNA (cytosine-5)-methyltransferase 1